MVAIRTFVNIDSASTPYGRGLVAKVGRAQSNLA